MVTSMLASRFLSSLIFLNGLMLDMGLIFCMLISRLLNSRFGGVLPTEEPNYYGYEGSNGDPTLTKDA